MMISRLTASPCNQGRRDAGDGTDHSQLCLEIEKLSNKFDKRQDDMLNSVLKQVNTGLEQNVAFRKQNDALLKHNDAFKKQNEAGRTHYRSKRLFFSSVPMWMPWPFSE
ncbi:hypothetical protein GMDG_06358 [Pseudogymnoascus destructans 20631-21]|uniref:Uncharacterized protein n=2 Tax=Pseudogymnoascus destructans TaxID=655981 RepID=L8FRW8_PSED2|nr:hypothetical protein GMDG_06358 [Pseudogymnoascus destructans 20631-21]